MSFQGALFYGAIAKIGVSCGSGIESSTAVE